MKTVKHLGKMLVKTKDSIKNSDGLQVSIATEQDNDWFLDYDEDEIIEYTTDPELIYEKFRQHIDVVIDGGYGKNVPSTVVDCTTENFEVIREGLGDISTYL